mmetsp:Transcript_33715/g.86462  ORF Transcript_33715/g.86462 Transcript_33715/m.86462 type:complete len:110 (+) Transcript_33715:2873-3202(+)
MPMLPFFVSLFLSSITLARSSTSLSLLAYPLALSQCRTYMLDGNVCIRVRCWECAEKVEKTEALDRICGKGGNKEMGSVCIIDVQLQFSCLPIVLFSLLHLFVLLGFPL